EGAAVGVTEDDPAGAPLPGCLEGGPGVLGVPAVAVEEVLRVVDDLPPVRGQEGDALPDHGQVLLQAGPQGVGDVEVPALAEDGHHRGLRGQEGPEVGVLLAGDAGPAGGAKGG